MGEADSGAKVRVAVIFDGGAEGAAGSVLEHLDPHRFEGVPVPVTPSGSAAVAAARLWGGADVVLPVLSGPLGGEGTVQGLLEMAGVPYVGAALLASTAGRNGEFTRRLLAAAGLPVNRHVVLRGNAAGLTDAQRADLGLPVVVGPARVGATAGVSRVAAWANLDAAIAQARAQDPTVIVEAAVEGRAITCGVLEFPDGAVRAGVPVEVHPAVRPEDAGEPDIPAKLDDAIADGVRALAVGAFDALAVEGLAQVGLVATPDGELLVDAVDTAPDLAPDAVFSRAWAITGIDRAELLSIMIETALARGAGLH